MVDNEPFAKGASKKLSVHIPAFFFLFGGRGGETGKYKNETSLWASLQSQGDTLISNDGVD